MCHRLHGSAAPYPTFPQGGRSRGQNNNLAQTLAADYADDRKSDVGQMPVHAEKVPVQKMNQPVQKRVIDFGF